MLDEAVLSSRLFMKFYTLESVHFGFNCFHCNIILTEWIQTVIHNQTFIKKTEQILNKYQATEPLTSLVLDVDQTLCTPLIWTSVRMQAKPVHHELSG